MNQLILCSGESKVSLFTSSLTLQILSYFIFSKKQLRATGMTVFLLICGAPTWIVYLFLLA